MEIWSKCDICGRDIPVGELCCGLKKGGCICKDCCTGFENYIFTLAPMSTLAPPKEPRMINADKLAKRIAGHSNYHGDSILAAIYCAAEGKENDAPIRSIETPQNEPLTQADVDKMHFDRVWIDYGTGECSERDGEEGVILYGKLYSIDTLDGAGLEDLLLDATGHGADTLDNPSGNYTVYRRPPEGEED